MHVQEGLLVLDYIHVSAHNKKIEKVVKVSFKRSESARDAPDQRQRWLRSAQGEEFGLGEGHNQSGEGDWY